LNAEVLNISLHGIWLWVEGREYFLPHEDFPWFERAAVKQIHNVVLLHGTHLYWPALDVDLHIESLESPHKYPLLSHNESR